MKTGFKTSEFWVAVLAGPLVTLIKAVWPEAPEEALYTTISGAIIFIIGRIILKAKNGG